MHLSGVEGPAGAVVEAAKLRRTRPSDCELLAVTGAHAGDEGPELSTKSAGSRTLWEEFWGSFNVADAGRALGLRQRADGVQIYDVEWR